MKAVILYDEPALTVKASSMLQRIGQRPEVAVGWTIKHCPIIALSRPGSAEEALLEATDAHLIIIPAGHALSPPLYFRDWLQRWAALRHINDAAVAVVGNAGFSKGMFPDLAQFAQEHGLNFLTRKAPAPNRTAKRTVRFSQKQDSPFLVAPLRYAQEVKPHALRGFGIND